MKKDIFTHTVHGIRLKYSSVGVLFLALAVALFRLGGPKTFGWYDFFAILVLVLMVLTLFLLQCQYVLSPIERMTQMLNGLLGKTLDSTEPLRLPWNGRDEFACLAAAIDGLLEAVQSRSLGALEENRRLKNVIASTDAEVVAMSTGGSVLNVIHCPENMEPVPGLQRGGAPDAAVWGETNCKAFSKGLAEVCSTGERRIVDLSFRPDGETRTRRLKAVISRPNKASFPIVVFRESEGLPPESRLSERKVPLSRIAAGMANDLRNVFMVIRNSIARYEGSESDEVRETLATIINAVRSGRTMIDDLVTLGGEMRLQLKRLRADELVRSARESLAALVEGTGVRIEYDVEAGLALVSADVRQIGRVLETVVKNAVEAFGAVPGRVRISLRPFEMTDDEGTEFSPKLSKGPGIVISVTDDGPGISAHVLSHAFEPYCTTKATGRGLGLAIADSIVAAHGGGMRIRSFRGISTCVEIFLRRSERSADEVDLLRREFPGGEVLVVDDTRSVLRITAALLRAQKIAAHVADCRADAIRKFGELSGRLRAVFLDAQLGDEVSVGLLQNMRDIDARVPVVVVSGYSRGEVDAMFAAAPPDAYLMKPYTVAEIQAVLEKAKG